MVEFSSFNGVSVNKLFKVVIICSALCLFILSRTSEQALLPAYMYYYYYLLNLHSKEHC